MRRTVLEPTMVAAALRARRMLVAMFLAALLALALTLAAPVAAQEETTSGAQTLTKSNLGVVSAAAGLSVIRGGRR